jgi:hypothetical protein
VVGGLLAEWFGLSAIGWFAAAIYSAGMLAAAADGYFGRTRIRSLTLTEGDDDETLESSAVGISRLDS